MRDQLPALQIVVPLVAAPLCVVLRRRAPVLTFALAVVWSTFAIALALLRQVLADGPLVYALGGWAAPWGIEYRVDALAAFVLMFVSLMGAVTLSYAPRSLTHEIPKDRLHLFVAAFLLCLTGLLGIVITGDLFNVFVFLEISALSSYVLIAMGRDRRALTAAFHYLVLGTIGATFILIGIGLLYMMTGTLNMADMATRITAVMGTRTVLAAFGFLSVGLFIKMALFPLHVWLPNAYSYAPSTVTAFLAATATKVSVYVMLRFVFSVTHVRMDFGYSDLGALTIAFSLAGIFVASTVAIFQNDVKRMLAYSSVAQIGYMVLGISFASVTGLTAAIVHLFNHALMKGGLFLAMGCFALVIGGVRLKDLEGVGRRMPWTTFAWVLGGLSLIGIPGTAGFISKLYLIRAALELDVWPVAALILLSSLLALVYVWRVVEVAYFRPPPEGVERREAPWSMLIPTWALVGASIVFGVWTSGSAGVAARAAELLIGIAP
ncbi:MAG: monovalent cation/H+ antiporter subunit D family protein [Acidobacteria bacterium]|nr:monovalent cation/H+ antiporter subunit D family protein [Acidobacteriota bacterium]NIM63696.1 monovalent cation/H+ antiporter subunit D family protein [Acidobacteriota bacterium]NIO59299.1 monovalent cation/H+ antiporter subunit D family protein [Acidobacteriota bacterium]NIQ30311.1 monovalent cation/H+ antiporter subunit D family protein [Acidobacteriota bacterium]NIQ85254.1 monovalent cation/H+ antiporter subunit D family protein [Acidobacteriota bacterium]